MSRKPIVGGNFKCNGTKAFVEQHAKLLKTLPADNAVEVYVAPTALSLDYLKKELADTKIMVAAQNCYFQPSGAWTGEISVELLKDFGIVDVVIGHSERRRKMGETSEDSAKKAARALEFGLRVYFCIGETLEEREAGNVDKVNFEQLAELKKLLKEE